MSNNHEEMFSIDWVSNKGIGTKFFIAANEKNKIRNPKNKVI